MSKEVAQMGGIETGCCMWRLRDATCASGNLSLWTARSGSASTTTVVVFRLDEALGHMVFRGATHVLKVVGDKPRAERTSLCRRLGSRSRQEVIGQFRDTPYGLDHKGSIPLSCRGTSASRPKPFPPGISPKRLLVAKRIGCNATARNAQSGLPGRQRRSSTQDSTDQTQQEDLKVSCLNAEFHKSRDMYGNRAFGITSKYSSRQSVQ